MLNTLGKQNLIHVYKMIPGVIGIHNFWVGMKNFQQSLKFGEDNFESLWTLISPQPTKIIFNLPLFAHLDEFKSGIYNKAVCHNRVE